MKKNICLKSGSKSYVACGIAALALIGAMAHADDSSAGRIRYTCVSPDGRSLVIENEPARGKSASIYEVRGLGADGAIDWSSHRLRGSAISSDDPNDVDFRFFKRRLLETCDPERHPVTGETASNSHGNWSMRFGAPTSYPKNLGAIPLPGIVLDIADSCYEAVAFAARIDVANPSTSELLELGANGRIAARSPLSCSPGFSSDASALVLESARKAFAAAPATAASPLYADLSGPKTAIAAGEKIDEVKMDSGSRNAR